MKLLYAPCSSFEEAKIIARGVVSDCQVLCCNIIPKVHSIYEWNGEIVEDEEFILLVKVFRDNANNVIKYIKNKHSYDVPAILCFEVNSFNEKLGKYLMDEENINL